MVVIFLSIVFDCLFYTKTHVGREVQQIEELLAQHIRNEDMRLTCFNAAQENRSASAVDELVEYSSSILRAHTIPSATVVAIPNSTSSYPMNYDTMLNTGIPIVTSDGEMTRQEVLRHGMRQQEIYERDMINILKQRTDATKMVRMEPTTQMMITFLSQMAETKANNPSIFGLSEVPTGFFDSDESESEKLMKIFQVFALSIAINPNASLPRSTSRTATTAGNRPLVTSSCVVIFTHSTLMILIKSLLLITNRSALGSRTLYLSFFSSATSDGTSADTTNPAMNRSQDLALPSSSSSSSSQSEAGQSDPLVQAAGGGGLSVEEYPGQTRKRDLSASSSSSSAVADEQSEKRPCFRAPANDGDLREDHDIELPSAPPEGPASSPR